ncbi:uncharacterized protein LOC109108244 [Cyprinus carpio]|uniref:ATP synthase peripheral stalk subunit F6, mitochondrial n=1 Tax=Cyprinus carpio TaxID=7962 RepID=A0A9Q9VY55_CYPCA|nr:uncharacterized protein LOC109108244 [Cyprinus carpio]
MFAIMSFQRIRRLRVLKFLWLDSWIQKNIPPLTPLCTKAHHVNKPIRYTSIKKAKPKTIIDIAKLLQQKAKETKEKKQLVFTASALKAAASPTKPTATAHKLMDQSDAKESMISNAKVQTSTSTHLTKDAVDSYTASLHNKAYTEMLNTKYAVESSTINAPQEASAQGEMNINISQVSELSSTNPSEVIPSSASEEHAGETDGTVYMPDVMVTSKGIASPEASSAHENGHLQEFSDVSEVVAVTDASPLVNSSQPQSTQFQDFLAATWSSRVKADKPSSGQEIITQALVSFPDGTANSILDISSAEAVAVASGEVPTLGEVCHEEAIQVSSPQSTEHLSVVETTSASLSKAVDAMSEMSGDAQRSIHLTDPILVQTEVLEEEATEELTEAQLDPVQKLFLEKIREYSTKSQAYGGPVDAGPEYETAFSEELNKLQRLYGSGDLTEFPEFKFSEPELDESSSK